MGFGYPVGVIRKRTVRACVAGLVFACALVSASSLATQADTVVSTIPAGESPSGVAINPAGTFAYVTNVDSDTVSKVDLATDTVATTIGVGDFPIGVAINPAGTFAYVTNRDSDTVSKIDLATDTVAATIGVGDWPIRVAFNPAGTFAYVANLHSGTVSKIDLANETVSATIEVGNFPGVVAIDPAGTFAYVTKVLGGTVLKIDLATDTVVAAIEIGSRAWDIAINPAGTFAYVSIYTFFTNGPDGDGTVSKINLATDTVSATIPLRLNKNPSDIAINPAGTFAYVTNSPNDDCDTDCYSFSKINLATDTVAADIEIGDMPGQIAINPAGTFAYVAHASRGANSVSKIALTATEPQSITFAAVSTQLRSARTVALSATASSSLAVAFTSSTPKVCTVSGSTVTMVTVGDCTINANQGGGSGWAAAPEVSRTFTILPPTPSTSTSFVSLSEPKRVVDTRGGGRFGSTSLSKVSVKRVKIAGATTTTGGATGLPSSGVGAVALNVTAVEGFDAGGYGFVTVYPCDSLSTAVPDASNLNFAGGQTIPNAVIAPVSADGYVCFSVYGNTDLLVDASGYFP